MNKYAGLIRHDSSQHMKNIEAQTKICPFICEYIQFTINNNYTLGNCICEKCMAWKITKNSKMEKTEKVVAIGTKYCIEESIIEVPIPYEEHEGFCKRLTND